MKTRYFEIIGLLILLGQFSCGDAVQLKTEYRLDRAGNPEYKEIEYQYIIGQDEQGNDVEIRHGLTREFYPNGQVKSEIEFSNGKIHGQAKSYFENGTISEISSWSNDLRDGTTQFFYENGAVYQEQNYRNGKLHGEQKTYFWNGKIETRITYQDDLLWQALVTHDTLGNTLDQLTIDNGTGVLNTYYPSGKIKSKTDFVGGMPNGKSRFFFESGKELGYVMVVDGEKHGELLSFHENGKVAKKALFRNDRMVGVERVYNQDGVMISESSYKDSLTTGEMERMSGGVAAAFSEGLGLASGVLHGPSKTYYDNGQLETEQYYVDGLQDGIFREYYDNGVIKTDIFFDDNYESGKRYERKFDSTGKVIKSMVFELRDQERTDEKKKLKELLEGQVKE